MKKFLFFNILILTISFCFAQQEGYRKSWALIIGINEYQSLPALSGAVKSAKLIREKLVRDFGFDPENVIELYDDQATRENILKAFDKLMDSKRVGRDDRVFVYFAGHGVTRTVGGKDKGYIMPVDGVMEKFTSTAISTDQLHEFQEAIPAKHVFFVMDACYSGTIFTIRSGYTVVNSNTGVFISRGDVQVTEGIKESKTRLSLPIGVGYEFNTGDFKVFIEVRRDFGLTKVSKENDWKISSTQLMLGAKYGF